MSRSSISLAVTFTIIAVCVNPAKTAGSLSDEFGRCALV
jgi:hypothetical protein